MKVRSRGVELMQVKKREGRGRRKEGRMGVERKTELSKGRRDE